MKNNKIIIIGCGVAGLATAIRLAVKGFQVFVYEKNNYPGGKLSAFKKDGYCFDAGPSLFTQPQLIEELFLLANEPIEKYFSYKKLPIACKYFYEDGKVVEAFTNPNFLDKELNEKLNEPIGITKKYLAQAKNNYQNIGSIFLNNSLHTKKTWINKKIIQALYAVQPNLLFKSLDEYNKKFFTSQNAQQLFNRYATYSGSNPYKAPAMLSIIPHIEYNEGVFYPQGGMISITNALYKLALKKEVSFYFNKKVQNIIYNQGKACGVVVDDKNIMADKVISNMDVYFSYKELLNNKTKAKNTLKNKSSSALVFYWGIKKEFDQLQLHNIFFTKNYKEEFEYLFKKKTICNDPSIYINITCKIEPQQAPPAKENWFVMVNAPENIGQDWDLIKQQAKKNIIKKLNNILQTDIEQFIETEETLDPITIEQNTLAHKGSLYGYSSNTIKSAFLRHPNFNSDIKNLYFCGGTVHPGGGIPLCMQSAKIVSELIKK